MRAAPLKGDCLICQAPQSIRLSVNRAIWPDGPMRAANYRAAGVKAAAAAAAVVDPEDVEAAKRYVDVDVKTITRHADHTEASWREVEPGQMRRDEVPISTDFSSVMEAGAELGMMVMGGFRTLVEADPVAFAALRPKEAINLAKMGLSAASTVEATKLKRNQQKIDVMAIFGASSGHIRPAGEPDPEDAEALDDLRAEVATERGLLAANN